MSSDNSNTANEVSHVLRSGKTISQKAKKTNEKMDNTENQQDKQADSQEIIMDRREENTRNDRYENRFSKLEESLDQIIDLLNNAKLLESQRDPDSSRSSGVNNTIEQSPS
ncbi:unnamed protein product [Lasius platythorax]|uniref:Uncharacterized protein n=1 Tax=Lasius platythorax TaxID=488582 RepID=A0AAV2MWK8_9HYME